MIIILKLRTKQIVYFTENVNMLSESYLGVFGKLELKLYLDFEVVEWNYESYEQLIHLLSI